MESGQRVTQKWHRVFTSANLVSAMYVCAHVYIPVCVHVHGCACHGNGGQRTAGGSFLRECPTLLFCFVIVCFEVIVVCSVFEPGSLTGLELIK